MHYVIPPSRHILTNKGHGCHTTTLVGAIVQSLCRTPCPPSIWPLGCSSCDVESVILRAWQLTSALSLSSTRGRPVFSPSFAAMASFEIAAWQQACEEVLRKKRFEDNALRVWLGVLFEATTLTAIALPGVIHVGLYFAVIAMMIVMAWHRADLLTTGTWGAWRFYSKRLRKLSLDLFFPEGYSAVGLAQKQRPARAFIRLNFLLKAMCSLVYFGRAVPIALAYIDEQAPGGRPTGKGIIGAFFGLFQLAFLLLCCCALCCLGTCLAGALGVLCKRLRDYYGSIGEVAADLELQQRIARKANALSTQMQNREIKASLWQRVKLMMGMGLFFLDFATDANCTWQYLQSGFYWLFGFQLIIVGVSLVAETRLLRKGSVRKGMWAAFWTSIVTGFPTDEYLSISMREKTVEAPLSFLLQSYATVWVLWSSHFPKDQRTRRLVVEVPEWWPATGVTLLSSYASLALTILSMTNAAYLANHLDVAHRLDILRKSNAGGLDRPDSQQVLPTEIFSRRPRRLG